MMCKNPSSSQNGCWGVDLVDAKPIRDFVGFNIFTSTPQDLSTRISPPQKKHVKGIMHKFGPFGLTLADFFQN